MQITLSLQAKIRSVRTFALWPFQCIAEAVQVPVSTVFAICAQPNTPLEHCSRRPYHLTHKDRKQLVAHATATQVNCCKPLTLVAEDHGIKGNECTLCRFFASEGYHRRIARARPFLAAKNKTACLCFARTIHDWTLSDWFKVTSCLCSVKFLIFRWLGPKTHTNWCQDSEYFKITK